MKNMLRIEFSRALKNKFLLLAILLGCVITVSHFVQNVLPQIWRTWWTFNIDQDMYPNSVFNQWIGETPGTMQAFLYYLMLPILAALPFGDSFYLDMKTGYIKNVFIRSKKSQYYAAKYLSTFVAGGIAVTVPLLLNLALTASFVPSLLPEPTAGRFCLEITYMGIGMFLTHPYVYTFLYLALDFLFAGLLAGAALSISFFVSNRFIVLLSPFIGYLVFFAFVELTKHSILNPVYFLMPSQIVTASPIVILVEAILLAAATMGVFFYKGIKDETF